VTVDGADEFDPQLRLIKGGGGALLHEKLWLRNSQLVIVAARPSASGAGQIPLPVEVVKSPRRW